MKYPKPKLFNPSPEEQKKAAKKVAKYLSPDKVLITQAGDKIRGEKQSFLTKYHFLLERKFGKKIADKTISKYKTRFSIKDGKFILKVVEPSDTILNEYPTINEDLKSK